MEYCSRCLQPDTRPGLKFHRGVCQACINWRKRQSVDWPERKKELVGIVERARARTKGQNWDCVIGVSGGKDTTFQALYCKHELRLHPLLVNCAPDNISSVGWDNLENLLEHGFDMITIRPNPVIERRLSRHCFFEYGNFVKPLEYPLYASAFNIALKFDIPLVIQGENPGETLGVDFYKVTGDAMQWKDGSTVAGGNASVFLEYVSDKRDLLFYQFPDVDALKSKNIKAIFLGYYVEE